MARRACEELEELPMFVEPVSAVSVEYYRDRSVEVVLRDANAQVLELFFDRALARQPCAWLYLKIDGLQRRHPVKVNSRAEREVLRLLRRSLGEQYSQDEQADLAARTHGDVRTAGRSPYDAWLIMRCLAQAEELIKLVTLGVVADPMRRVEGE